MWIILLYLHIMTSVNVINVNLEGWIHFKSFIMSLNFDQISGFYKKNSCNIFKKFLFLWDLQYFFLFYTTRYCTFTVQHYTFTFISITYKQNIIHHSLNNGKGTEAHWRQTQSQYFFNYQNESADTGARGAVEWAAGKGDRIAK